MAWTWPSGDPAVLGGRTRVTSVASEGLVGKSLDPQFPVASLFQQVTIL